jgi:hypothetical protein
MRSIAKAVVSVSLLAAACASAFAQDAAPSAFKGIAGLGFTFGGDTLASGSYTNGDSWKVSSGGGVPLYGGIEYRVSDQFVVQGTVGYHSDRIGGDNGSIKFTRVPVEAVGLYSVNSQVRLGGGVQHASSPKISSSGVVSGNNLRFDASTALVLEGEYLFGPSMGMKLRYVGHKFNVEGSSASVNGDHLGVMLNFYF